MRRFLGLAERLEGPTPWSNRPEQILQSEQIGGSLLPALDTDLAVEIAEAMQQGKRHQPARQCGIDIGVRISESAKETVGAARQAGRHEGAGTQQIVLLPPCHDVAKVDEPG